MAKLYINPAARIPNEVDISGKRLFPFAGDAIVSSSPDYAPDFYEQPLQGSLVGTDVRAYTQVPAPLAAMLEAAPDWMLAPQLSSDKLLNLGRAGGPEATLKNGALMDATSLTPGVASVFFDNTNDYIETGWETRANVFNNPMAFTASTGWADSGTTGTGTRTPVLPDTKGLPEGITTGMKIVGSGGADGSRYTGIPVEAGKQYTLSFYIYRIDSNTQRVRSRVLNTTNATIGAEGEVLFTAQENIGVWVRASVTFTPAETGTYRLQIDTLSGSGKAEVYATGFLCEQTALLKTYFPTPSDVSTARAVFAGTAHASVSDIGPWARNAARTYLGFAYRAAEAGNDSIIGCAGGANAPRIITTTGAASKAFLFDIQRTDTTTISRSERQIWPTPLPNNTFWAVTFDDPSDTVKLGVNGTMQVAQTARTKQFDVPNTGNLIIGADVTATTNPWSGYQLPFAVYTRVLSDEEIAAIYSGVGS